MALSSLCWGGSTLVRRRLLIAIRCGRCWLRWLVSSWRGAWIACREGFWRASSECPGVTILLAWGRFGGRVWSRFPSPPILAVSLLLLPLGCLRNTQRWASWVENGIALECCLCLVSYLWIAGLKDRIILVISPCPRRGLLLILSWLGSRAAALLPALASAFMPRAIILFLRWGSRGGRISSSWRRAGGLGSWGRSGGRRSGRWPGFRWVFSAARGIGSHDRLNIIHPYKYPSWRAESMNRYAVGDSFPEELRDGEASPVAEGRGCSFASELHSVEIHAD